MAIAIPERKDALLGSRLFFVATSPAQSGVKAVMFQTVHHGLGAQQAAALGRTQRIGVRPIGDRRVVGVHQHLGPDLLGERVAKLDHLGILVGGIDVQQRKGDQSRVKGFAGQMQQNRRVLADGIKQHGLRKLRSGLAQNVYGLGFDGTEMR